MPNKARLQHMDFFWGIRPEAIDTLDSVMATVGPEKVAEYMAAVGSQKDKDAGYQIRNGVAVIPITGTITKGRSFWSFLYGGGNLKRLTLAVNNALADPKVSSILLDIDSPGGTVSGTEAFSNLIYSARETKPIVAFGNGMMTSAAYWIGSGANKVIIERTTDVGSIGVLYVHWDTSKEDEMYGWKRTLITAGEFKGVGNDIEPLSDRDRGVIQAELDTIYDIFTETVARNRGVSTETVLKEMAGGRVFIGQQAVDAGLAEKTGTFDDALQAAVDLMPPKSGLYFYQSSVGAAAPGKEFSAMSGNQEIVAPKTAGELTAMFPNLSAEIRQQGADSVDTGKVQTEATTAEKDRIVGLAKVHFGEETAGKFEAIINTGVTVEQYKAIRPEPVQSEEEQAINKAKEGTLAAIAQAGAENPGAGEGDGGEKDFMAIVDETMATKKVSKFKAMQMVVKSHPKLHQQYIKDANRRGGETQ
jgi:signal peptide peptidase SppA